MSLLRKFVTGVVVIVISSAIFFLLVSDKKTKKDLLRPALEALGEKLFAVVRPDSSKESLQKNYQDFIKKAEAKEIKPEEIEKIAAAILNLSARDSLISSKDAMKILALSEYSHALPRPQVGGAEKDWQRFINVPWKQKMVPPDSPIKEKELAERLHKMHELERKLQNITKNLRKEKNIFLHEYMVFKADSGLMVKIDLEMKKLLHEKDRLLAEQLSELEKKNWLQWQEALKENKLHQEVINDSLHKNRSEIYHKKDQKIEYYLFCPPKMERR